jgi:pimeloyl-ACP methyl ester carboxylesterase
MRDSAVEAQLRRYQSNYDGSMQSVLILQPSGQKSDQLFFFFHGMDGDAGDGVVVRDMVKRLRATVIAMGGRGPAWVANSVLADTEQVIRTFSGDFQSYHLIGVSMGGTQALVLAALLPDDLRQAILGVIALIPGTDLPAILQRSANERIKNSIRDSVDGDVSLLQQRSPTNVLDLYRPGLPFLFFCRLEDTLLLADEVQAFIVNLRAKGHPEAVFSAAGEHEFTYKHFDFVEAIKKLGSNATEYKVPLLSNEPQSRMLPH